MVFGAITSVAIILGLMYAYMQTESKKILIELRQLKIKVNEQNKLLKEMVGEDNGNN